MQDQNTQLPNIHIMNIKFPSTGVTQCVERGVTGSLLQIRWQGRDSWTQEPSCLMWTLSTVHAAASQDRLKVYGRASSPVRLITHHKTNCWVKKTFLFLDVQQRWSKKCKICPEGSSEKPLSSVWWHTLGHLSLSFHQSGLCRAA